jgi:uncharacterized membrane protein
MSYASDSMTNTAGRKAPPPSLNSDRHITDAKGHPNVHPAERIVSGLAGAALAACGAMSAAKHKHEGTGAMAGGAAMAVAGGYLLYRGITGHCPGYAALRTGTAKETDSENAVIPHGQGIRVEKAVIIARPAQEIYDFWRDFENLPRFMSHLEEVQVLDGSRSRWVAKGPMGKSVCWEAEIINEMYGEMIAWKSVEPADVPNTGTVFFRSLGENATEVRVVLEYLPPAGRLGAAVARLWGEEPAVQIQDDLNHLKQLFENGMPGGEIH